MSFSTPMAVGRLNLGNRLLLAPLAGVTDAPFRRICQELGAGLTFVEMLSAGSVIHGVAKTKRIRRRHDSEAVLGVQVTGRNVEELAQAVGVLDKESFELIDINMGCPAKKVVSRGSGSAILRDPDRLRESVLRAREATAKPLSVKVRLGYDEASPCIEEIAGLVAEAGADMFTIHGRYREDRYNTPVDHNRIRRGIVRARECARGPMVTVGNGDILNAAAGHRMADKTECDAVMVSRGAMGNPWIFRQLLGDEEEPTIEELMEVLFRHLAYHEEHYGRKLHTVATARKHLLWYVGGFPGTRALREKLSTVESMDAARDAVRRYAKTQPEGLRRDPTTMVPVKTS